MRRPLFGAPGGLRAFAAAAIVVVCASGAAVAANWSHTATGVHTTPTGPVIRPGQTVTVTGKPASSGKGDLTIKTATGSSASTVATTTRTIVNADGSTTTTTLKLTKFGAAKDVTITGTYTTLDGVTKTYTFTFASLNSGAQTIGSPPAIVTATPDAATGKIKVQLSNGHKGGKTVTVKVGPKAPDKTTTASTEGLSIDNVTAFSGSKITTEAVSVLNGDNTTTTTTTATTAYGAPKDITIRGLFANDLANSPYKFTFASMSSAAQSIFIGGVTLTVTPNAATNTLTVTALNSDSFGSTLVSKVTPPTDKTTTTEKTAQPEHAAVGTTLPTPPPENVADNAGTPAVTPTPPPTPTPTPGPVATPPDSGPEASAAAAQAEIEIARCGVETPTCVANVLDAYAAKLDAIAPKLPEKMRTLPAVFREAARKVRTAKTKAEATRAIRAAIVQVRNTISFLRAVDPDQRALGAQVGREAVGVLQAASVKLERATGL